MNKENPEKGQKKERFVLDLEYKPVDCRPQREKIDAVVGQILQLLQIDKAVVQINYNVGLLVITLTVSECTQLLEVEGVTDFFPYKTSLEHAREQE